MNIIIVKCSRLRRAHGLEIYLTQRYLNSDVASMKIAGDSLLIMQTSYITRYIKVLLRAAFET